jgi:hypothetical protein
VDRDIKSAGDTVKSAGDAVLSSWRALQAKVSADMDALNAKIALGKHNVDVKHADHHAERLEREASFAVDYAVAAIEEAKYAVLDAIVGRVEAEKTKRA